jgi:hypothetical protein
MLTRVLRWMTLLARSEAAKDVEITVPLGLRAEGCFRRCRCS